MYYFFVFLIFIIPNITFAQNIDTKEILKANYASVIMYHRFGDSRYPSTNIKKEQFLEHITELLKPKYNVISIEKALNAINNKRLVKDRSVVITIDDAYSSVFNYAWPIFKKNNIPFALFVSTDVIDNNTPGYMSWEQIRILRDNGVTIGSQTKSHPHMFRLDKKNIINELSISNKRFVDEIGSQPKIFAYPYGEYNLEVLELVKLHGFKAAFGQHSGIAHKSLGIYELPRFAMNEKYGGMERFLLAVNALPMPISDLSPKSPLMKRNPPYFGFTLSNSIEPKNTVRCFASSGIKSDTKRLGKNRIEVRLSNAFSRGRGRINCTMAAEDNRWRWLGRQFITK
ncbi:polysaccharide deacetylase family protein [Alphaproteobacteria bacterium]|nr:polysaccharide deacetylase family protein [Alphaproteobacteria bacterium]